MEKRIKHAHMVVYFSKYKTMYRKLRICSHLQKKTLTRRNINLLCLLNPLSASVAVIETSQLICSSNQLTGFYMRATLALKGLT